MNFVGVLQPPAMGTHATDVSGQAAASGGAADPGHEDTPQTHHGNVAAFNNDESLSSPDTTHAGAHGLHGANAVAGRSADLDAGVHMTTGTAPSAAAANDAAAHAQTQSPTNQKQHIFSFILGTATSLASSILGVMDGDNAKESDTLAADGGHHHHNRDSLMDEKHGADAALVEFPPMTTELQTVSSTSSSREYSTMPVKKMPVVSNDHSQQSMASMDGGGREHPPTAAAGAAVATLTSTTPAQDSRPPLSEPIAIPQPSSFGNFVWDFLVGNNSIPREESVPKMNASAMRDASANSGVLFAADAASLGSAGMSPISEVEMALAAHNQVKIRGRTEAGEAVAVLNINIIKQLHPFLPMLLREASAIDLIYSLEQHGISLNTLYSRCKEAGPCLIAIRDENENLFGAFASESVEIRTGFYGNGSCFLWKQSKETGVVTAYPATGSNQYLILSEPHCIAFGGGEGHFGLWIDDDLYNGHSEPCQTFANSNLSSTSQFHIMSLEVWSFNI